MDKKYYLAADGGGSKLLGILYDDDFKVIRHCKLSGVNMRFKPLEAVKKNLSDMLDILLGDDIKEVESADVCLICNEEVWRPIIEGDPRIKSVTVRDEPAIAISSAFMRDGIVALSGTGSDIFLLKDGKRIHSIGGWGPLLGDEGSGYDIGVHAIKAAISDFDGRGEPTALRRIMLDRWETDSFWNIVFDLARDPDARHKIASTVPLVGRAAEEGDKVAQGVYKYAVNELLHQTYTLIKKEPSSWNGDVVIMGGAWKSYSGMFDYYKSELEGKYPHAKVIKPIFEPVVGCAICRAFDLGLELSDFKDKVLSGFAEFLYKN